MSGSAYPNDATIVSYPLLYSPGLLGEIAHWVYSSASYPNPDIAMVTAISLLSGLTGKAYNTYTGAGLNQYILLLADTGMGKEVIAQAIGKIASAMTTETKEPPSFKGPSHLASVQALIKWLDKHPAILCVIGEFGQKLKAMSSPKASPNDTMLLAGLLDLYAKSGAGGIIDPMAYSDATKNTASIFSPSVTLVCETVPSSFYELLDERMITSGLLPRFCVYHVTGKRPYLNSETKPLPPMELVQKVSDLAAYCLSLAQHNTPLRVPASDAAAGKFREFEHWATDEINNSSDDVTRQLWNRANLKALKLASVRAVGINYLSPQISIDDVVWATNMIANQTNSLLAKFSRNEVGMVDGNEAKQRAAVLRICAEYGSRPYTDLKKYDFNEEMHRDLVITHSYLARRLATLPAFVNDRPGPTAALKRVITRMLEDDELVEISSKQLMLKYGSKPKSYSISNPRPFLNSL